MPKFLFALVFLLCIADVRSQIAPASRPLSLPPASSLAAVLPRTPNLDMEGWRLPERLEYSIMSGARLPRVIQGADHLLEIGGRAGGEDSPMSDFLRRWSLEANAGVSYLFQNGWRLALTYRDGPEDPREMYRAARGVCLLFRYGLGAKHRPAFW